MGIEQPDGVDVVGERERQAALGGRARIAVEQAMADLVTVDGGSLRIGDTRLAPPPGRSAEEAVDALRARLVDAFRQRRPNATPDTWRSFRAVAEAVARRHARMDPTLERALVETVDGL